MNVMGAIVLNGVVQAYFWIAILLFIAAALYWYFFRRQYGNLWTGVIIIAALVLLLIVAYDVNGQRKLKVAGEIKASTGASGATSNNVAARKTDAPSPSTLINIDASKDGKPDKKTFTLNDGKLSEVGAHQPGQEQKSAPSSERPSQRTVVNINVGEGNIFSGGDETTFGKDLVPRSIDHRIIPDLSTKPEEEAPPAQPSSPGTFVPAGKIKVVHCPDNPIKVENKLGLPTDNLRHMCLIAESVGSISHIREQDVVPDLKLMLGEFYTKYKHILDDNNDYDNHDDPKDQEKLEYRFKRFLEKSTGKGYGTRNWAQWLQSHRLQVKVTFFLD